MHNSDVKNSYYNLYKQGYIFVTFLMRSWWSKAFWCSDEK